jgi:hypothetical protein
VRASTRSTEIGVAQATRTRQSASSPAVTN